MFFRRPPKRGIALQDRLAALRAYGFEVQRKDQDSVRIARGRCAADIQGLDNPSPRVSHWGILAGGEIGSLVDGGFMKFVQFPNGRRQPALAADLRQLQAFQEDLREALGLPSLYNQSLGTVCDRHVYDRLSGR